MGWQKLRNGDLLAAAAGLFDAMLTTDRNLKHQQNLATLPLAVIVLVARTNRLADLLPLVPRVEQGLRDITGATPGSAHPLIEVTAPGG
jgi:hypothetical protein